jgi:D-psicose/D-tagatose/L-ribulose 3-epimerase
VNAAYALGAHVVGGPLYSAVGRVWKQTPDEREHDMQILVGQLRQLSQYAADHDVKLGVEALNRFETSFVNLTDQAIEIVDRVDHPACKVMVDTFHANIEESKLGDALRRAGDRLVHVHTCENDRGTPGSGHLPWEDVAAALKDIDYQGACVIESFTNKVETIAKAAAIWRPWPLAGRPGPQRSALPAHLTSLKIFTAENAKSAEFFSKKVLLRDLSDLCGK